MTAAAVVAGFGSAFYHPLGASVLQLNFADAARGGRVLGVNGAFGSLGRTQYPALFFMVAAIRLTKVDTTAIFGGLSLFAAAGIAYGLRASATGERGAATVATRPERQTLTGLLDRSMVALMVLAFFRSLAFIGIVSLVPIYLTTQRHAGVSGTLGAAVTVMYAGDIIGQQAFGMLADRFDKRLVLAVDSLGSAGGIFVFLGTSGHGAGAIFSLALFGFFTFARFPLLLSLVADHVPKERSTTGNALVWDVGSTGARRSARSLPACSCSGRTPTSGSPSESSGDWRRRRCSVRRCSPERLGTVAQRSSVEAAPKHTGTGAADDRSRTCRGLRPWPAPMSRCDTRWMEIGAGPVGPGTVNLQVETVPR